MFFIYWGEWEYFLHEIHPFIEKKGLGSKKSHLNFQVGPHLRQLPQAPEGSAGGESGGVGGHTNPHTTRGRRPPHDITTGGYAPTPTEK